MSRTEDFDRNMAVTIRLDDPDIRWHDVHDAPVSIHGFCMRQQKDEPFRRLPKDVAEATSEGVAWLSLHTAGGRVRFMTDSPCVAIHAEMESLSPMDHMAFTGIFGFDLYVDNRYCGTFRPSTNPGKGYESKLDMPDDGQLHEVTINMPLYNRVDRLYIGVRDGSTLAAAKPYPQAPVVYYGSSITQGGCASRPGNSYQAMITRTLGCDHINLGFSGSGKGEKPIVDYMASLDMSVFVCDYDCNSPSPEHLRETHPRLYHTVREKHPDLPYIIVTRPDFHMRPAHCIPRREAILETYEMALKAGDRNVSFIDGEHLFDGILADSCTVDGCHPNDLGFFRMAQVIGAEVAKFLK